MTAIKKVVLLAVFWGLSTQVFARDTTHYFSINDALSTDEAKEKLNPNIKLTFGAQRGRVIKADLVSNKKTNAVGKSDEAACHHVFLSAVLQFQETAASLGGQGVTNLHSYYKKNPYVSKDQYECHAGAIMAGVALKGDVVK